MDFPSARFYFASMPQEIRRILFTYPEVADALISYGGRYNMEFPQGTLAAISSGGTIVISEVEHPIIVTFLQETQERRDFTLTGDFLIMALIDFCLTHAIVLPKSGRKTLEVTPAHVSLDIEIPVSEGATLSSKS